MSSMHNEAYTASIPALTAVYRYLQMANISVQSSTYCDGAGMVLPNDLAISSRGYVYISGQRWTDNTVIDNGRVWLCKGPGQAVQLTLLGRTNGIGNQPG